MMDIAFFWMCFVHGGSLFVIFVILMYQSRKICNLESAVWHWKVRVRGLETREGREDWHCKAPKQEDS